jgi:hypothetical protein
MLVGGAATRSVMPNSVSTARLPKRILMRGFAYPIEAGWPR